MLLTEGGKTLLTIVPALLNPEGVIIIVAPFRALVDNIVNRFRATSINYFKWKFREVNLAIVIVVSANVTVLYRFLSYDRLL
jgi:superfamily II DNA helicase RecQ